MSFDGYIIGNLVLNIITFVVPAAATVPAIRSIKTESDPARKAFSCLKLGIPILALGALLQLIVNIIGVSEYYSETADGYWEPGTSYAARVHLFEIGELLICIGDAILIITLALLDRGISIIKTDDGAPGKGSRITVIAAKVVAGLMTILWFVSWAMATYVNVEAMRMYSGSSGWVDTWFIYLALRGMRLAYWVFATGITLALLARAAMAMRRRNEALGARTATHFLLASTLIWFARPIYNLYEWANFHYMWVNGTSRGRQYHEAFTAVIFGVWPVLVAFVVLLFLGRKQASGLWSDGRGTGKSAGSPVMRPSGV